MDAVQLFAFGLPAVCHNCAYSVYIVYAWSILLSSDMPAVYASTRSVQLPVKLDIHLPGKIP